MVEIDRDRLDCETPANRGLQKQNADPVKVGVSVSAETDGTMEGATWNDGAWEEDDGVVREVMDLMLEDAPEQAAQEFMRAHDSAVRA